MGDPYAIPLPRQPKGVAWPTKAWTRGVFAKDVDVARIDKAAEALAGISALATTGETRSLITIHRGQLVGEYYSPEFYEKTPFYDAEYRVYPVYRSLD